MTHVKTIAEIGNTHEGSLGLAKQFIKAAAECGVDAVKFQIHIFDAESLPTAPNPPYFKDETRKEYFERTAFSKNQWQKLKDYAEKDCGVEFLASPFSNEAVDLLEAINVQTYKIASGEVTNLPMLKKIARTKKAVLLSSGMSFWQEIDDAVECLVENGCGELTILQCTSDYPCLPKNAGLNVLDELKERYPNHNIGYSDHTLGVAIPIAAVCKGATVIEKHFTLSKKMYGSDAQFSSEPDELKFLVASIRGVEQGLQHHIEKDEKAASLKTMKKTFEKMIVAAKDLPAGTVIKENHLAFKKPMDGIPSSQYMKLLGKKLNVAMMKDSILKSTDLS
ncbi:MAG: N-acetylneuraminate synthase family protein [Candidatus Margulisiibacteriota bacterium]